MSGTKQMVEASSSRTRGPVAPERLRDALLDEASARAHAQNSETYLRALLDRAPFGIHSYVIDPAGRLVFDAYNPMADAILHVDHSRLVGLSIEEAFPSLVGTVLPILHRRTAGGGGPVTVPNFQYRPNGKQYCLNMQIVHTGTHRSTAFFTDVSALAPDRREADDGNGLLREVLDNAPFGTLTCALQTEGALVVQSANEAARNLLARPAADLLGQPLEVIFPALGGKDALTNLRKAAAAGGRAEPALYTARRGLDSITYEVYAFQTEMDHLGIIFTDVTDRERSEARLRLSEDRFKALFEQSTDEVFVVDRTGRISMANTRACKALGFSFSELTAMNFRAVDASKRADGVTSHLARLADHGGSMTLTTSHRKKNGTEHAVEVTLRAIDVGSERLILAVARNVAYAQAVARALEFAARLGWDDDGPSYLDAMVQFLSRELRVDGVAVGEWDPEDRVVSVVAASPDIARLAESRLSVDGTAAGDVVTGYLAVHATGVWRKYPKDALLQRLGAEGFAGTPLWSTERGVLGLIALYSRAEIEEPEIVQAVLEIVAVRASHELERARFVAERLRHSEELDARVAAQTDLLRSTLSARARLIGNMSHELRTPMHGVLGWVAALRETPLSAEQLEMLTLVERSANSMMRPIDDLLAVAGCDAPADETALQLCNVRQLMAETVDLLRATARLKGLELASEAAPSLPGALFGDRVRVSQILANLAGNAVACTEAGRVALWAEAEDMGDGVVRVTLRVSDTGPTPQDASHEEAASSDATAGTAGVRAQGLETVRRWAELQGGSVRAAPNPGGGAVHTVALLLHDADASSEPACRSEAATQASEPQATRTAVGTLRALVVDDIDVNRALARRSLESHGITVDEADGGLVAVSMAEKTPYDVIMMDIQMADLDGLAAARAIRRREAGGTHRARIVAMTAYVQPGIREKVAESGMDAFLAKPFGTQELVAAMSGAPAIAASSVEPGAAPASDSAIDMPDLIRRVDGNTGFALELLELYRSESLTRLAEAHNAVEAKDRAALKAAAHTLKGTAGQVSAKRVAHRARLLELASADAAADTTELLQELQADVDDSHTAIDEIQAVRRA
jgi:PAS domain S-box-containing protein